MSAPGAGLVAYLPAAPWVVVPAHGVGNRADLPLPFEALVIGAALALLASFVGLAFLWREPRLRPDDGWPVPRGVQSVVDARWFRGLLAGVSLLLTGWVLLALVFGRDDVTAIPAGAPTYVTQRVRAQLGGVAIPGRILPAARTISTSSAKGLFSFMVRANIEAMSRRER